MKGVLLPLLFFIIACERIPVEVASKTFTFKEDTLNIINVSDSASQDHYFQRLDSAHKYGFSFNYKLTEDDRKSRLALIVKGKIRSNYIYSNGAIVFITHQDEKQTHWSPNNLRNHIVDLNVWNRFYDSIALPENTEWYPFNSIVVQSMLGDSKFEKFDLDSVTFKIKR